MADISIRMYNVGFGDCFMVTIPSAKANRPMRILFDCGSIALDPAVPIDDVLQQVWADATDPGADHPRITVVIGTHRHRDHVSGFSNPGWRKVEVDEVWMPWTEHPTNAEARRIRETQSRLAVSLEGALKARLAAVATAADRAATERLLELALNALSNERAMATLHEGFAGTPKRRFLPEEGSEPQLDSPALPGVGVYILAPSRDKDVIRDMDPPAGQSYLRLSGTGSQTQDAPDPFAPGWRIDADAWTDVTRSVASVVPDTPVARLLGQRIGSIERPKAPELSADDREALKKVGEMSRAVAVSLDKAVNGTSLMVLLRVGQAYLLFPGDAQWGSWQAALRNDSVRELLKKVTFYKVGHHGSHNATPIEFVEQVMPDIGIPAMISTRPVSNWPDIPRPPLLTALTNRHCDWIRSDLMAASTSGRFQTAGKTFADVTIAT